MFLEQVLDSLALLGRSAERDHELQVTQAEVMEHRCHGLALHLEGWLENWVEVSRGPSPCNHRVLLLWLEEPAAQQIPVLVGLEVGETDENRPWVERRTNQTDAFPQFVDEESPRVVVVPAPPLDGLNRLTQVLLGLLGEIPREWFDLRGDFAGI